jgi:hypothetical protein
MQQSQCCLKDCEICLRSVKSWKTMMGAHQSQFCLKDGEICLRSMKS